MTPQTPTGKRHLADVMLGPGSGDEQSPVVIARRKAILAIEAEAAQQERKRLRSVPILGDGWDLLPYPLPEWVKTPTRKGEAPIDLLEHFRDWLLADPVDDR